MPRRIGREEEDALLRARGTSREARATDSRFGDRPKLAYLEMLVENFAKPVEIARPFQMGRLAPAPGPAPWAGQTLPLPLALDQRPRVRRGGSYSAAFQPGFFPYSPQGYAEGRQRAIWLRDTAKTIQREGFGTAVLLVEHQPVGGGRILVAGINGSFNANQHGMLDQLRIVQRYNLRDRRQTQGHPDVVITFGQIGGIDSDAVAIGSSIPFCRVCLPQIDGAGFELIPDPNPYEAVLPIHQAPPLRG